MSVSHRHIIVLFRPGLDGGFSQIITCQYRTSSEDFRDVISRQFDVGYLGQAEFVVSEDLEPNTGFYIRLVSDNDYLEGRAAESDVITVTTRGHVIVYSVVSLHVDLKLNADAFYLT